MGQTGPTVLEFRAAGDQYQDRQMGHVLNHTIEQLARRRISPVRVFENEQDGVPLGQRGELTQKDLERPFTLPLRAETRYLGRARDRKQLPQQSHILGAVRVAGQQVAQFCSFSLWRIVTFKTGGVFELHDDRIQRAVLPVRRAEIAQTDMPLAFGQVVQGRGEARLADAGLTSQDDHAAFASFCLAPSPRQQIDFLSTADQWRRAGPQCLEPAQHAAFADHAPGVLWLGEAGERFRPQIDEVEQVTHLPPGAVGDDDRVGLGETLDAGGEVRCFADDAALL